MTKQKPKLYVYIFGLLFVIGLLWCYVLYDALRVKRAHEHRSSVSVFTTKFQISNRNAGAADPDSKMENHPQSARDNAAKDNTAKSNSLAEVLTAVVGVRDEDPIENIILMTAADLEYLKFVENWICSAQSFNYKFFIWAAERELFDFLRNGSNPFVDNTFAYYEDSKYHDDTGLVRAGKMKPYAVLSVLQLGYHVWFVDVDIVFLNEAFQFFAGDADLEYQVGMQFEVDLIRQGIVNTGYFLMKSNERTISLMTDILSGVNVNQTFQKEMKSIMESRPNVLKLYPDEEIPDGHETNLTTRALDPWIHPSGAMWFFALRRRRTLRHMKDEGNKISIVHGNWLHGFECKSRCFQKLGVWLIENGTCDPTLENDVVYRAPGCEKVVTEWCGYT